MKLSKGNKKLKKKTWYHSITKEGKLTLYRWLNEK